MTTNQPPGAVEDEYRTMSGEAESEIRILGSRFIARAFPVTSAEVFDAILAATRREHYNATHHCSAWRCGFDGRSFRASDDGEPAGTAGRRILGTIDHHGLTNTGIIVIRYFGGTKLGTGGLARAYTEAADAAIASGGIDVRHRHVDCLLTFPYDLSREIHHILESHGAEITMRDYLDVMRYGVRIRLARHAALAAALHEHAWKGVLLELKDASPEA